MLAESKLAIPTNIEELREIRKTAKVSIAIMAEELLISSSYYSSIENGRRRIGKTQTEFEIFLEDAYCVLNKIIKQRKEDSYILEKNLSSEDEDTCCLIWQLLTDDLYEEAINKLKKGLPFYKVCFIMEIDELELEKKLQADGFNHLINK